MKKTVGVALILVLLLFLIPLGIHQSKNQEDPDNPPPQEQTLPQSGHTLSILVGDQVQEMDLNQYLWGVVAAEMPASFSQEALKAQAVAARTYALSRANGASPNHPNADLCTDYACCQAWISREKAENNWGSHGAEYVNKITAAVADTNDQVILYDNQLIRAVFHSSSGDATQDAVEVWGNQVPYLQSVASPEGDEVPNYHSQVTLTPQEFKDAFLAAQPSAVLEGDPASWLGDTQYTGGGSVHSITIGGVSVTGAQARKIFSLRSAAFTVAWDGTSFIFSVTGYGHGVGMSQYGANAMAKEGSSFRDILTWYYTGAQVDDLWAES